MRLIATVLFISAVSAAHAEEKSLYLTDLLTVKSQMETYYIDSSRFTTIENLDDTETGTVARPWQAINQGGGALTVIPSEGFARVQFQTIWFGPYISWNGARDYETAAGDYDEGAPLDLNGTSSIYFYTPLGLLEPKTRDISLRYYGDDFSSYYIVTHGANGVFDGNLTRAVPGDDVAVEIPGFTITVPVISSVKRNSQSTKGVAGWTVTVRGYNLGTNTGSAAVLIDGSPASGSVSSWTTNTVEFSSASEPALGASISIRLASGAIASRSLPLVDANAPSAIVDWSLF